MSVILNGWVFRYRYLRPSSRLSLTGNRRPAMPCHAQALSLWSRKALTPEPVSRFVSIHARPAPAPTVKPTPSLPPKSNRALAMAVMTWVLPSASARVPVVYVVPSGLITGTPGAVIEPGSVLDHNRVVVEAVDVDLGVVGKDDTGVQADVALAIASLRRNGD